ncbi:MAG TPA: UTP--glucose-1-phosphate uridylyltransferase GalU [Actinomycetota bacterium]|jgi:UTP--glucose-1-phosphate uridylyltransferase
MAPSSTTVRKAVLPAAGLGTRFLPATKSQPKEMLPVLDKPGIQYVVEEAVRAGLEDILIITGRGKGSLEDHFDRSLELEAHLERAGKDEELAGVRAIADLADIHFVRQKEPLGFGHAVLSARRHVGGEPFVVMVGDEIVPEPVGDEAPLLARMIELFGRHGGSVLAVQEVPEESVSSYGIVAGDDVEPGVIRISRMIEKPAPQDAPSNLAARGRYVFESEIFDAIEKTSAGVGGEIQLTDAIQLLAEERSVFAYTHEGPIYDAGKKLDWLRATLELALRRDDLAKPVKELITELAARID